MKKLLSILAATALVFGFASCSGDLHDAEIAPLYVQGDMTPSDGSRVAFTMDSDTEQHLDFTYATTMTSWGGGNGTVNFKIVRDATGWAQDWGWKKDIKKELEINADEPLELEARDASNSNPGNLVLKDLEAGQTYRLIVKYDAPTKKVALKVTGAVTDYPTLRVVNATDDETYIMKRSGSKYEYVFTPEDDGSFDFYITNGYLFWGDDGDMDNAAPSSLATVTYEKKNYQSGKPVQYVINVDASKLTTTNKLTITSGEYDTTILAKAAMSGPINGWGDGAFTRIDELEYAYDFENTGSTAQFVIKEVAGDWGARWCAGVSENTEGVKTTSIMNDVTAAKYGQTGTSQTAIYCGYDTKNSGKTITVTGLPYSTGHQFRILIKILNESNKDLAISCVAMEDVPASEYDEANFRYSFEGLTLKGGWDTSWGDTHTLTSSAIQTYTLAANNAGTEWGIFGTGSNLWKVTNLAFGTRTEMTYAASGTTNSTLAEAFEDGATYTLKLELTDDSQNSPKAFVTITKNE